jgi:hypothetical protein
MADLVLHCTDSASADPTRKRPWQERKDAYLERLAHAGQPAALITAADKLHNITATLRDVREHGPDTLPASTRPTGSSGTTARWPTPSSLTPARSRSRSSARRRKSWPA